MPPPPRHPGVPLHHAFGVVPGAFQRFANTADGVAALAAFCQSQGVGLVAMEATGGYEKRPFALLWAQDLPCAILNPRDVRRFAEAMGVLEKTDRIDAAMIAWCAEVKKVKPSRPADETQERLKALVLRLSQLTNLKTAQTNQRRLVSDPTALASFEEILALLARQMRALETEIAALINADPLWRASQFPSDHGPGATATCPSTPTCVHSAQGKGLRA